MYNGGIEIMYNHNGRMDGLYKKDMVMMIRRD